jgi:hypothetical protein
LGADSFDSETLWSGDRDIPGSSFAERWVKCYDRPNIFASVDERRRILLALLSFVPVSPKVVNDLISACARNGTEFQMELVLALQNTPVWLDHTALISSGVCNLILTEAWHKASSSPNDNDYKQSVMCRVIDHSNDDYLNLYCPDDSRSQYCWPLKSAVGHRRPKVLLSLLKRLPGINFDLYHPKHAMTEPLTLSIPNDNLQSTAEIKELVAIGSRFMCSYYADLPIRIRSVLAESVPCTVIAIIELYSARRPLSTQKLKPADEIDAF